jgi:hypothetical protein
VNSEELELSLRTEFESYLKGVLDGMRRDVADFQKNFEAEFDKHRTQMDDAVRKLSARFESEMKFDKAFTESVVEHLRLARDDGAKLTAQAFTEAQKLDDSVPPARYDRLRDAIRNISSQLTQSSILRSLVDEISAFTPRGAFFIVKHDNFVCWRKFDRQHNSGEDSLRDINFPVSADTLLADAVHSLDTKVSASGPRTGDGVYLQALGFGNPDRMIAVPLIARGRGVAVLYVDSDNGGEPINLEAVESLVRVAGLTVELRAAAPVATQPASVSMSPSPTPPPKPAEAERPAEPVFERASSPQPFVAEPEEAPQFEYVGEVAIEETSVVEPAMAPAREEVSTPSVPSFAPVSFADESVDATPNYAIPEVSEPAPPVNDFAFASESSYEMPVPVEAEVEPETVEEYSFAPTGNGVGNGHSYEPTPAPMPTAAPEPVVEVATAQPAKSRLSDRHVDLPIEVSDEERRLHNDARRFARLLVSEIKLYNEQKVNEGRNSSDLYDRLREAIDRSREMYDKRVQPQVAAKFDYFHYELVKNLAEGNDSKLGVSYPGAHV